MADISKINNGSATYNLKDSSAVHLAGSEEITGSKTVTGSVVLKSPAYRQSETPASNNGEKTVVFRDADNKSTGVLGEIFKTDGTVGFFAYGRYIGDTTKDARLDLLVDKETLTRIASLNVDKLRGAMSKVYGSGFAAAGMPGPAFANLTLTASGEYLYFTSTSVEAPRSGWLLVERKATAVGQYMSAVVFLSGSTVAAARSVAVYASDVAHVLVPVPKGAAVKLNYTVDGTVSLCRFVYANAEIYE